MKIIEIVKNIFHESPRSIQHIPTGLTNDNYKIELSKQTVVLRIPKPDNAHLFDYGHEAHVIELVAGIELDTHTLYYDKTTGIKATLWAEDAETFRNPYIERAAALIQTLHSKKLHSGKRYNLIETYESYKQAVKNPPYSLDFAQRFIDKAASYQDGFILCHNDLVQGNLLFSRKHDYLIDYEYAMDNHPYFDVMSFLSENDIQDGYDRQRFYKAYFKTMPSEQDLHILSEFERAHHALWCQWAMMMYEQHHEAVFKEIADLKFTRLKDLL